MYSVLKENILLFTKINQPWAAFVRQKEDTCLDNHKASEGIDVIILEHLVGKGKYLRVLSMNGSTSLNRSNMSV